MQRFEPSAGYDRRPPLGDAFWDEQPRGETARQLAAPLSIAYKSPPNYNADQEVFSLSGLRGPSSFSSSSSRYPTSQLLSSSTAAPSPASAQASGFFSQQMVGGQSSPAFSVQEQLPPARGGRHASTTAGFLLQDPTPSRRLDSVNARTTTTMEGSGRPHGEASSYYSSPPESPMHTDHSSDFGTYVMKSPLAGMML